MTNRVEGYDAAGRARLAVWAQVLVVLLALVALALVALGIAQGDAKSVVVGGVLLAADAAMVAFCKVDTYVGDHDLVVTMPPFARRTFAFADIERAEATTQGSSLRGLGYRMLGPAKRAYLSGGPELRLTLRDGSEFIFSCPTARELAARLDER